MNGSKSTGGWIVRCRSRHLEFDIPAEATAGGILNLSVVREPGTGGAEPGNAVAESSRIHTGRNVCVVWTVSLHNYVIDVEGRERYRFSCVRKIGAGVTVGLAGRPRAEFAGAE